MSRVKEKLSKMNDKELAILVKYNINDYLKSTQKEILAYSKKRNLNNVKINELTSNYAPEPKKQISSIQKFKKYIREVFSGILEGL